MVRFISKCILTPALYTFVSYSYLNEINTKSYNKLNKSTGSSALLWWGGGGGGGRGCLMSKFLHNADKAKAIAIPRVFSENSRAKKFTCLFKCTLVPFSFASFLAAAFSLTRLKKSSRQLECLTCSTRTLIRLGMIRFLPRGKKKKILR